MAIIVPVTILAIFILLFTMFRTVKWAVLILISVTMASVGGPMALFLTRTNFSVSSAVGFLALFGVSVQVGVIMIDFINQIRARGSSIEEAAVEGAVLRLRPIMMTMLVATLGLLPAAVSHAIGSDSQRPFAIVIVGGLLANLMISIFLLPTIYVWAARPDDVLPAPETEFENSSGIKQSRCRSNHNQELPGNNYGEHNIRNPMPSSLCARCHHPCLRRVPALRPRTCLLRLRLQLRLHPLPLQTYSLGTR